MIGCSALPVRMSSSAVRRAWLLGMEKPRPMLPVPAAAPTPGTRAIALLTPITRPRLSTSGPPELPGLIAASVWIALMNAGSSPSPAETGRLRALTMPVVTVPRRPSGAPMATTGSPTTTLSELPSWTARRPLTLTFRTARSYESSRPTSWAWTWVPSWKTTSMRVDGVLPPAVTTWLFVRM